MATLDTTQLVELWNRIQDRLILVGDCMVWTGATNGDGYGYGVIRYKGRCWRVHRIAYEAAYGPVADGMVIDHVKSRGCTSRRCCNRLHLEAVTNRENILRGTGITARWHSRTHCEYGHPLSGYNLRNNYGKGRECRECYNRMCREYSARKKAARL